VINVAASISRAQQTVIDGTYSEYEPHTPRLNPIISVVLLVQVAAAVSQYIALQAVHPAPANALILCMLGALAVVTHTAVYLFSGNGILLLAQAGRHSTKASRNRRLSNALRQQRRAMFRHYQAWTAASHEYKQKQPGEPVPELDPVIVAELNAALGTPTSPPPTPPQGPTTPPTSDGPPNPYQPVNPNDDRI
jgi:hypothetical protein